MRSGTALRSYVCGCNLKIVHFYLIIIMAMCNIYLIFDGVCNFKIVCLVCLILSVVCNNLEFDDIINLPILFREIDLLQVETYRSSFRTFSADIVILLTSS